MEIYTVQIAKYRMARELNIPIVDTTRKSGVQVFAPDWDMIMGHKEGTLTSAAYTEKYRTKMLRTFNHYRPEWESLIEHPLVALACYCSPFVFCHRHLLVDIMEIIHHKRGLPFYRGGEITDVNGVRLKRSLDGMAPLGAGMVTA